VSWDRPFGQSVPLPVGGRQEPCEMLASRFDTRSDASPRTAFMPLFSRAYLFGAQPEAATERRFCEIQKKLIDVLHAALRQSTVTAEARLPSCRHPSSYPGRVSG